MEKTIRNQDFMTVVGRSKMRLPGMSYTASFKAVWTAACIDNLSLLSGKVRAEMGPALCLDTTYIALYIARLSHALVVALEAEQKIPLDENGLLLARKLAWSYAIEELGIQDQAEKMEKLFKNVTAFDKLNEEFNAFGQQITVLTQIQQQHRALKYGASVERGKRQLLMSALRASTAYAATQAPVDASHEALQVSQPGEAYRQLRGIFLGPDGKWNGASVDAFTAHLVETNMRNPVVHVSGNSEQEAAKIKAKAWATVKARTLREYRNFFTQSLRCILDPSTLPLAKQRTEAKRSSNGKPPNNFLLHHSDLVLPQAVQVNYPGSAPPSVWPQHSPTPQMLENFLGQGHPIASFFTQETLKKIHGMCPRHSGSDKVTDRKAVTTLMYAVSDEVRQHMGPALCTGQTYHDLYVVLCAWELKKQLNPNEKHHTRTMQIASSYAMLALGLDRAEVDALRARLQNSHFHSWKKRFDLWGQHLPWLAQTLDSRVNAGGYANPEKIRSDCESLLTRMLEEISTQHPTDPPHLAEPGHKLAHAVAHFFPAGSWDEQRAKDVVRVRTAPKTDSKRPTSRLCRNQRLYASRFTILLGFFRATVEQAMLQAQQTQGTRLPGALQVAALPLEFPPLHRLYEPIDLPESTFQFSPSPEDWDAPELQELTGNKRTASDAGLKDR
jgi:hypothetical protein